MSYKISDLNIKFLGINPVLKDKTGELKPEDIAALSALLTFKGKSVKALYKEAKEKGQDIDEKVLKILRKSSLRGHASIATTPVFSFNYEASKFIDTLFTGIVFSSSLMASGRRTDTTPDDIVYPDQIADDPKLKKDYEEQSIEIIKFLKESIKAGLDKDATAKILHYGIYGTGIISLSIESLVGFKREYEAEREWMPKEAGLFLEAIEKELKNLGVLNLYATRLEAPRDIYPFPNILKNPNEKNLARELIEKEELPQKNFRIESLEVIDSEELKTRLKNLKELEKETFSSKEKIKTGWKKLLEEKRKICRDFGQAINVKVLSRVAWRAWGEKKRHRTVPMIPDSLYFATERAREFLSGYSEKIKEKNLSKEELSEIDRFFAISPELKKEENKNFLYRYLEVGLNALNCYEKLIEKGVKPSEAIYIVPRAVKLDILQEYNLYNLLSGYYPVRTCSTVEEHLQSMTLKELLAIQKKLRELGQDEVAQAMKIKCELVGFCLEEKSCGRVKKSVPDFDDEFHKAMFDSLEKGFQQNLREIEG